ncbi:hypothetical protein AAC387_Pa12g1052 [Persea americana]
MVCSGCRWWGGREEGVPGAGGDIRRREEEEEGAAACVQRLLGADVWWCVRGRRGRPRPGMRKMRWVREKRTMMGREMEVE